ncbi:HAD family hydrolase [Frigidibacter sp. ROC022]|uniref:HAD family hydrolase n=1 Tax=Frigidibacter sp. ROC022 TaxID=2971796 RepID=UPI00215B17AC|nr:HAD family phosphatase [Frigidibacter sp. ROC022]MCR8724857.1 HAD family phosphatase [Frigidibacter sp. ROC022]
MTPNPRPRAVIFDCDGVLVDSEPVAHELIAESLSRHGLPISVEEVSSSYIGGTMANVAARARDQGATLPEHWVSDIYAELYARLAEGVALIEGILPVLERLDAAAIPYAVGSNGTRQKMAITLGQHPEVMRRVEGRLWSAHDHGTAKPDPGLYLLAAEGLGVAPGDCVVVDDSPSGCTAGVRAGMRTLGFAEHDDGARLREIGAEVFHRMSDLPGLLGL